MIFLPPSAPMHRTGRGQPPAGMLPGIVLVIGIMLFWNGIYRLSSLIRVETHQVFVERCPLNMRYVFRLAGSLPKEISTLLQYKPYTGRWAEDLLRDEPMIPQPGFTDCAQKPGCNCF